MISEATKRLSDEISSICKVGWVICLELGRTGKGWAMMGSGGVEGEGDELIARATYEWHQ